VSNYASGEPAATGVANAVDELVTQIAGLRKQFQGLEEVAARVRILKEAVFDLDAAANSCDWSRVAAKRG